jgi:gliding motility-associated-like protein
MRHKIFIFIITIICFSGGYRAFGQITWTTGYTADDLAAYLAGDGVEVDNATINCHNLAFGYFDCVDCNVGIDSGIVLTTGRVSNIAGPNNLGSTGTNNSWPGDADLNAYPGVGTTHDACVLEFDVYSPGDSLKFDYVFGSDEYPEFVGSINDAFVFWISGPGYAVPTNIALIPGTALPVTIDNVNAGDYPEYYNANGTGGVGVWAADNYYIEYDGFTTVLSAKAGVSPCSWYHLKLAIGDESDFVYDSGVFLKAKSLVTNYLADFTYPGFDFGEDAVFCTTEPDPDPVLAAGADAGTFTASPAGLDLDPGTGALDLSNCEPGTYILTNTLITGFCDLDTFVYTLDVIIEEPGIAGFLFPASPYCSNEADPAPVAFAGGTFGTFTSTPAGLVINPATGVVDLDASTPGVYTVTNTLVAGAVCPGGVATASITIHPAYDLTEAVAICDGESYTLPDGGVVLTGGTYVSDLLTTKGCDSTITTTLTVNPVYDFTLNPSICLGAEYTLPDGTTADATGTYINSFTTAAGCDSVYTVNLTVNPVIVINPTVHLCDGETYTLADGTVVDATGLYPVTLVTGAGCDSTINTTVFVHPVYDIEFNPIICADASYTLPDGTVVNTTGVYVNNFLTTKGCDSIITTNLTVNPIYNLVYNPEICIGETYTLPDGAVVAASGTFNYNYVTGEGCDSNITVNLTVHPLPVLDWIIDDIFCMEQGSILMEATPPGGTYSGTGIAGDNFVTATAGVGGPFTLTYEYTDIYGCYNSMTVTTSVDDNYAIAWGDTSIFYGEDANLFSDAGGDYTWSPIDGIACVTCPETTVIPPYTTDYIMTSVDENGCIAQDNVLVTIIPDPLNDVFVPNTFTPNGDNINDMFFAFGWNITLINSIQIFDRWGEQLYFVENVGPTDLAKGWDGTINGTNANNGVYAFIVEVQFETGQRFTKSGNVTLIR